MRDVSESHNPHSSDPLLEDDDQLAAGRPAASELILSPDPRFTCETYIFEPAPAEAHLGRLYAVGEIEDRGGIGRELLDMTIQALQREYYREPARPVLNGFESALHQANLVLHDAAEQGVRDWMGYFHVAIGVLAGSDLHISTAGDSVILLVRRSRVTLLTQDLSYSPITNPLRTFAQVASGTVTPRDVLYFGTSSFRDLFRHEDLSRFAIEHAPDTISTRLEQLYADQQAQAPLASLTVSVLPAHIATLPPRRVMTTETEPATTRGVATTSLIPRQPLVIHRTALRAALAMVAKSSITVWQWLIQRGWPLLRRGSHSGRRAVTAASAVAGRHGAQLAGQARRFAQAGYTRARVRTSSPLSAEETPTVQVPHAGAVPGQVQQPRLSWAQRLGQLYHYVRAWPRMVQHWLYRLPRTSKIFAGLTVVLALILVVSLFLLQQKRADDTQIQQASERLHEAQTKVAAAETALIYNNRDQAQQLLSEARASAQTLSATGLYHDETQELQATIETINDRLQRIVRASTTQTRVIGDFASLLDGEAATSLSYVNNQLYTYNPATNAVLAMQEDGTTEVVTETSAGIGFLQLATVHPADKSIVYVTDTPSIAVLDATDETLTDQEITFTSDNPQLTAAATYGSRLYVYDQSVPNIVSYSKTLRGYTSGSDWIVESDFPKDTITSFAIDGSVYTLHRDGTVRELFKGEATDFTSDPVDPPLTSATRLITYEGFQHLYVLDPRQGRVVVLAKDGELMQQLFLDVAHELRDIAIASDESTLYVLDGTRVLAIPLTSE